MLSKDMVDLTMEKAFVIQKKVPLPTVWTIWI